MTLRGQNRDMRLELDGRAAVIAHLVDLIANGEPLHEANECARCWNARIVAGLHRDGHRESPAKVKGRA